jgi:hypothetical protein
VEHADVDRRAPGGPDLLVEAFGDLRGIGACHQSAVRSPVAPGALGRSQLEAVHLLAHLRLGRCADPHAAQHDPSPLATRVAVGGDHLGHALQRHE